MPTAHRFGVGPSPRLNATSLHPHPRPVWSGCGFGLPGSPALWASARLSQSQQPTWANSILLSQLGPLQTTNLPGTHASSMSRHAHTTLREHEWTTRRVRTRDTFGRMESPGSQLPVRKSRCQTRPVPWSAWCACGAQREQPGRTKRVREQVSGDPLENPTVSLCHVVPRFRIDRPSSSRLLLGCRYSTGRPCGSSELCDAFSVAVGRKFALHGGGLTPSRICRSG